ncbi:hypothetical protein [Sphingomonas oryzagri]
MAMSQLFVILLAAIAKVAGVIAAGTALAICVAASLIVAAHALILHHRTGRWRK